MSKYTTGEMAKRCGVTVRTVQYYDARGLLTPSELTEGGRRLYTDADVQKMKVICFLRETGVSIHSIGELLHQENPERVIAALLDEQEKVLRQELDQRRSQLEMLGEVRKSLKNTAHFSLESIADIAHMMKNKESLRKMRTVILATAIPFGIVEWGSLFLWIFQGIWWPFALYALLAIPYVVWILQYCWKKVAYLCPQCHTVFKPKKKEFAFARHTMSTRKLTCPCCGHKGFCVETCAEEETGNGAETETK